MLVGVILSLASGFAEAAWAIPHLLPRPAQRLAPPDQSWLMDVPERPGARSKGRVAVFAFDGDDYYQPVRAAVVRALRRHGLNVTASLRPLDSAMQYREMSVTLNLAVFVEGELRGDGPRQKAAIRLRSGVSGRPMATARFAGPTEKIAAEVERTLWTRLGPAILRACTGANRPRRREREPLRIDAGTPADERALASQGS